VVDMLLKMMNERGYGCYLDGLEGGWGDMDVFIVGDMGFRWFYRWAGDVLFFVVVWDLDDFMSVCMYICVCVYVCMCICVYVYMCVCVCGDIEIWFYFWWMMRYICFYCWGHWN